MMGRIASVFAGGVALLAGSAAAQTHIVHKPEDVVRAVAVYEWTGDEAKPNAMRLIPVTVLINGQLEDGGAYLARPVPLALDRGTVFETQVAGKPEGTVEIALQRHLEGTNAAPFDDGWLGYGVYKPALKESVVLPKQKGPVAQVEVSGGKHGASAETPVVVDTDPDRPVLVRREGSDSGDASASSAPADTKTPAKDADAPTMHRRDADTSTTGSTSASTSGSASSTDSSDDAERPTLKRRTATQGKQEKRKGDTASVQSVGSLNDDPDRPTLHRGTAAAPDIQPLEGLPKDMKQMVAVSDAKQRSEHDFVRPWESDSERADVLSAMQAMARNKLASYGAAAALVAAKAPAPSPAKTGVRTRKSAAPPPPPAVTEITLTDESLRGYTLSYGGAATFVYTASSPGDAGATRYVSVVAQQEGAQPIKLAMATVTDSNHLDRVPWMRMVDVVDVEASNRASLLFELRSAHARQFALYRVIGAVAEPTFTSGTTQ